MPRRSTPQSKADDAAFPVRVKIANPENGLRQELSRIHDWLGSEVGHTEFAVHSLSGAVGVYFRDTHSASAFLSAFPDIQLADGTQSAFYSRPGYGDPMEAFSVCNLYSMTSAQDAIREIAKVWDDRTGNLPAMTGIFPDYAAPVVHNTDEGRVLAMMRWGMPSPSFALKGKKTDKGITKVRNTKSPHWRRWLDVPNRCVVPFTSFSEYQTRPGQAPEPVWFALNEDRPLAFFAGIWTQWTSVRKLKDGETTDKVGSDVERAYARSDLLEKRRELMTEWTKFAVGN